MTSPTPRSRSNARAVLGLADLTKGSGRRSAASELSGIPYNRLRSLAAGTKEPTPSERSTLAAAAAKVPLTRSIYEDATDSGLSQRESLRRVGKIRKTWASGSDRRKAIDVLSGVGLSDDRYAAIFGHARGVGPDPSRMGR